MPAAQYLVPSDLTMGQFIYVIRKRIKLPSDTAIFVFVNNALAPAASLISQVDKQHRDEDNFLYLVVSSESTFG
jgi:GABA(A) receptor-associated protein